MSSDALNEETGLAVLTAIQAAAALDNALTAHGLPPREAAMLMALPPIVEQAMAAYQTALQRLAWFIAAGNGDRWSDLPYPRKQAYLRAAFDFVAQYSPGGP